MGHWSGRRDPADDQSAACRMRYSRVRVRINKLPCAIAGYRALIPGAIEFIADLRERGVNVALHSPDELLAELENVGSGDAVECAIAKGRSADGVVVDPEEVATGGFSDVAVGVKEEGIIGGFGFGFGSGKDVG